MIVEQFVFDFNKKTVFIWSCSYLINLDIETPYQFGQQLIYAKVGVIILPHTKIVVLIHHLDISRLWDFFFQPGDIGFALSVYLINTDMISLPVKNNINRPIYISQNFCLRRDQELKYPNIKQLYPKKAKLAK